jgi:hypothetical protein
MKPQCLYPRQTGADSLIMLLLIILIFPRDAETQARIMSMIRIRSRS